MFSVTRSGPNRLDMELQGRLDSDQMRVALDELLEKSADIEHGAMLYKIHDFHLPTLGAIGVEFSRMPALLRMIRRFDKAAVLVDQKWLQRASEIEGALFPGLDIRAFNLDQADAAETWLTPRD